MDSPVPYVERRSGGGRRKPPKFPRLFSAYSRRRKWGRRSCDGSGYVDIYDVRTWAIALSVLILSILDGLLTSLQISAGRVTEANPFLEHVLASGGSAAFFAIKATLTALALAVIVLHKEWRIGKIAARFCLWSYILVAVYHIYLVLGWPHISRY